MTTQPRPRAVLAGSDRTSAPATGTPADLDQPVDLTFVLRRRAALPADAVQGLRAMSSTELGEAHGADPADVALVRGALAPFGAAVTDVHLESRRLTVRGTLAELTALLDTTVTTPADGQGTRRRSGGLSLPAELDGVVTAVLGLDDRPTAAPRLVMPRTGGGASYTPVRLGEVYRFPAGTDGTGQTVAVVELGGGFHQAELDTYFHQLGVHPAPVTAVGVDGGSNSPGEDADGEVLLDLEVIGALAPGARMVCYFAPNTDRGFLDAVATAVHATPTPVAVSISWGQSEDQWTAQARHAFDGALADAAALGVTVTVAAGDNGSTDNQGGGAQHVDFPASSPHALACGGTNLLVGASGVPTEVVWETHGATGGGVSAHFAVPAWQKTAGVPARVVAPGGAVHHGRGVPDVSGDADPSTGYEVLVNGQAVVYGGTSAVAPLWAALVARLVESLGHPLGLLQPLLYAGIAPRTAVAGFRDITVGSNGAYRAGTGWDACTGLGVPDGEALLQRLQA